MKNEHSPKNEMWYDLDNAANIFPAISDDRNTNVFRIACELREMVDRDILQQAVERALKSLEYFQVVMRRGLFWFYLEPTAALPTVTMESQRPCHRLFYISQKELLFQVTYYNRRINLEVFHSVSDGTGSLQLLRTILYHYITLAHPDRLTAPLPPPDNQAPLAQKTEDSFLHHYNPDQKKPPKQKRAFTIGGTLLPGNSVSVICGDIPTKQILGLAKSRGVTVTAYLATLMLCAIYSELTPIRARNKPIGITVPVDLRNHFPSETGRNFFGVTGVVYNFQGEAVEFDKVLASVTRQLAENLKPEALAGRINYTMGVQQNIFARAVPLQLKNLVLKAAYSKSEHATTCALSNLGRIPMPEPYHPFVDHFSCLLNPTPIHRLKACICSFESHFIINFTSCIAETRAQKYFFRHLTDNGVEVCITCNGVDDDEIL